MRYTHNSNAMRWLDAAKRLASHLAWALAVGILVSAVLIGIVATHWPRAAWAAYHRAQPYLRMCASVPLPEMEHWCNVTGRMLQRLKAA